VASMPSPDSGAAPPLVVGSLQTEADRWCKLDRQNRVTIEAMENDTHTTWRSLNSLPVGYGPVLAAADRCIARLDQIIGLLEKVDRHLWLRCRSPIAAAAVVA
jgi:hypothetical protein